MAFAQWAIFKETTAEQATTSLSAGRIKVTSKLTLSEQQNLDTFTDFYGSLMAAGFVLLVVAAASHLLLRREPAA